MCPKFTQVFLAVSTLLFFVSFEILLYDMVTISPGLISRSFFPAKCKIIHKLFNGNITCHIDSLINHGKVQTIPCFQVYVTPLVDEKQDHQGISANSLSANTDDKRKLASLHQDVTKIPNKCNSNCNSSSQEHIILLYQSEYNFAGLDYLYRRCSYLPSFCANDVEKIHSATCDYAHRVGELNATIDCFYDRSDNRAIFEKKLQASYVVHAILWPLLGVFISIFCCIGFWKRNYKHISRLYIYNSWAAS